MRFVPVAQLPDYLDKDLGHSDWFKIDQNCINQFADCTGDQQFIHVDPDTGNAAFHQETMLLTPPAPGSGAAVVSEQGAVGPTVTDPRRAVRVA